MKEFEVTDNELLRIIPVDCHDGYGTLKVLSVITKEEFLACYNAWVRGEKNDT